MKENYLKLPRYKTISGKQLEKIYSEGSKEFYSYSTKIAKVKDNKITLYNGGVCGGIYLNEDYHYSRTTLEYLKYFLNMDLKQIRQAIKNNKIILK